MPTIAEMLRAAGLPDEAKDLDRRIILENTRRPKAETDYGPPTLSEIKQKADTEYWLKQFITQDARLIELKKQVLKLAPLTYPVLIVGETGTGKELIARALHGARYGRFVAVNTGGFPEQLVDSELFGHVRGSFTGAVGDKAGLFAEAQNGTIFLDEIAELPMLMQSKLLRVLQQKTIRRVGSNTEEEINCRVVCATNKDLVNHVVAGTFREDLYWRISTIVMNTVPIRDRLADVPLITQALGFSTTEWQRGDAGKLMGNVRELQQIVIQKLLAT